MTEIEAYKLLPGEEVVMRKPGQLPRAGIVERIFLRDLTPETAMALFDMDPIEAVKKSFDGPIILVNEPQMMRSIWSAPHVQRAYVDVLLVCTFCRAIRHVYVPHEGFMLFKAGARLDQFVFDLEDRDLISSRKCPRCHTKGLKCPR